MSPSNNTIWVIVPVYNVQKWLKKCVRSIQRQTYTNWKAVLVDDGSTDRSGQICDDLARSDPRILVIHMSNRGPYIARLTGIEQADADSYCLFCDSDDEMPPNALELLHSEAVRTGAELVCGNMTRLVRGIKLPAPRTGVFQDPKFYDRQALMHELYISCFGLATYPMSLCAKLYPTEKLRQTIREIQEHPKCFAEDLNVTMHLFPRIESISVIAEPVYHYRIGGGTSRFMPTFLEDNLLMYHIKRRYAPACISEWDVPALVAIEMKNIFGTYLVMCEKFQRFSQGSLAEEVRFICGLDEMHDAMSRFNADKSGIPGFSDAIRANDHDKICELIKNEVARTHKRDLLKRILMG